MKKILRVQLCPFGEYPNGDLTQICDRQAMEQLLSSFDPTKVYVDREHWGEDPDKGDTRAAAWVKALYIDDVDGLLSDWEITPLGEDLILTKELRYLSPVWYLGADNRPKLLKSIGLTNTPNIPVKPIMNKSTDGQESAAVPGAFVVKLPLQEIHMEKIIARLKLPAGATEDDVIVAIDALEKAAADAQTAQLTTEAENVCKTKNVAEKDRADFVKDFVLNKGMLTLAMVNKFGTPPVVERVVQPRLAVTPELPAKNKAAADEAVLNKFNEMPEGKEKRAFLAANSAALFRARVAADAKKGE